MLVLLKRFTSLFLLGSLLFSSNSLATNDSDLLGDDFEFSYSGQLITNISNENGETVVDFSKSFLSLSTEWKRKIKLVITANLEKLFEANDTEFIDDFDLANFILNAYVEIKEVGGYPVAVIIGKQNIPFSSVPSSLPIIRSNPLAAGQTLKGVFGVVVRLDQGLGGLFDKIDLGVFESEPGDFKIGKIDGMSVRISKELIKNWSISASYMSRGNSYIDGAEREHRTSIGLIVKTEDGKLMGWTEGIFLSNHPSFSESDHMFVVGGKYKVTKGTDVVIEYNYIEKELQELGIGVSVNVTPSLQVGAEVRYKDYKESGKDNEFVPGVIIKYLLGKSKRPESDTLYKDFLFE